MLVRVGMHERAGAAKLVLAAGVVCILLCGGAVPACGASQTLRVTTRLVVVNVVAHNKKHEPVKGLTRGDFTILDNGKLQQVSVFSVERGQAVHAPSKRLPPNVFSNRVARDGNVPVNAAVILLDGLDTGFADSAFARYELIKFIRQMPLGERVALYLLGPGGLSVIQDFTSDPSPLLEAIRRFHGYPAAESAAPHKGATPGMPPVSDRDALNRIVADMNDHPTPGETDGSSMMSGLEAVSGIAKRLSGLPGRKSLIWVTDRVPYPGPQSLNLDDVRQVLGYSGNIAEGERQLRKAVRALNQSDVAVYPVDAHGLTPYSGEFWILDMDYWAHQTGGRAFYFTNGLSQAIGKALDDSKVTYTLGYYPSGVAWNGEYRHIKVLVDRKQAQLRYRRGYYATAAAVNTYSDPVELLETAAASPLDSTGLGITVRLDPIGNPPLRQFKAMVYVDGHRLTFQPENGHYNASFMVWAGQYSKQGGLLEEKTKKLSFKLNETHYRAALAGGLGLALRETADPGASDLRVAVLDLDSLATGSVRINLRQ